MFGLMDEAIADELGVDIETYINIIENKCTDEDAEFIIMTILGEDNDNLENAKQLFNKYLMDQMDETDI